MLAVAPGTWRHGFYLGLRNPLGQQLRFVCSRETHPPGATRVLVHVGGFDEPLPVTETFLERPGGAVVEVIAARPDGRPQQGSHARRRHAETAPDGTEYSAGNAMEGSHAAGMGDRNNRGVQGVKHDGKAVGGEYSNGRTGQMGYQRIRFNPGNAVCAHLPRIRIDNMHAVAVDLADRV